MTSWTSARRWTSWSLLALVPVALSTLGACGPRAATSGCEAGCGGAGGGGAGGGSGGGSADGCIDLRTSLELVDPMVEWVYEGSPIWTGVWRDEGGLVLAWAPRYLTQTTNGSDPLVVLSRFDLATGTHVGSRGYSVIPTDLLDGSVYSIGGAPDGSFLVTYSYLEADSPNDYSTIFYALGSFDEPGVVHVLPEVLPQYDLPTHVHWDGEAFAVHADGGPPGGEHEIVVARVAPDGTVVTPRTPYGSTAESGFGPFGYELSFDPVTGRSWAFQANFARSLNAHELDGTPIVSELAVELESPGGESSSRSSVSAHADGADLLWLEWYGFPAYGVVQRRDGDGEKVATVLFEVTFDTFPQSQAVLHLDDGRALVVSVHNGGAATFEVDLDTGAVSEPALLIRDVDDTSTDFRELTVWEDQHGRWLAFQEASAGLAPEPGPAWRVVKIAKGCVYDSWRRTNGKDAEP
jgi:hypothetical protein